MADRARGIAAEKQKTYEQIIRHTDFDIPVTSRLQAAPNTSARQRSPGHSARLLGSQC
jgi:hypothetical protein